MTQPLPDRDRASIATRGSGRPALGMGRVGIQDGTSVWAVFMDRLFKRSVQPPLQCRRHTMLRMAIQSRTMRSDEAGCESQPQRSHGSIG